MKKYILFIILSVFTVSLFAQDTEKVKDTPIAPGSPSGYLIDAQTTVIQDAKSLEFSIQHNFGNMNNGISDLWGIYTSANVRLALDYVPVKNLQLGAGITKKNMYTDLNAKWLVLRQTERNTIPVSVALYGVMGIDGRNESVFGIGKTHQPGEGLAQYGIRFTDRFSYFSQLIVSRQFTDWLMLQVGASFSHYNMVNSDMDHDKIGAHVSGKLKFSPQSSFIFNYDAPLKIKKISEQIDWTDANDPLPNMSFGVEIATYTHTFQIYVATADGILPQDMIMYNHKDWKDRGLAIGFTITRLWMF